MQQMMALREFLTLLIPLSNPLPELVMLGISEQAIEFWR